MPSDSFRVLSLQFVAALLLIGRSRNPRCCGHRIVAFESANMIPSVKRTFTWLVTGVLCMWLQLFLVTKRDLSFKHSRNPVSSDYVQSFSSFRDESALLVQNLEPMYKRSEKLPQWMKDYFDWHREQTKMMNETNFEQNKYLILRCTKSEQKCGGLADRIKSLPFFIAAAANSKRIFMIRWSRPTKLEEFLLPNEVKWSVPDWMDEQIENNTTDTQMRRNGSNLIRIYKTEKSIVLESLMQDFYGGSALYHRIEPELDNTTTLDPTELAKNNMAGWKRYEVIFHDLFRALFKPSPPIAKLVEEKMETANLTAGNYVSCHYRAFYAIEDQKEKRQSRYLKSKALNAVNCASMIMPGAPIYFASDSQQAIDAVRRLAVQRYRSIVTIHEDTEEALHLDKATDWESRDPSEFYPTFVDLLLMANGRCTAYGEGGFGRFGALLSHNSSCIIRHNVRNQTDNCKWTNGNEDAQDSRG